LVWRWLSISYRAIVVTHLAKSVSGSNRSNFIHVAMLTSCITSSTSFHEDSKVRTKRRKPPSCRVNSDMNARYGSLPPGRKVGVSVTMSRSP